MVVLKYEAVRFLHQGWLMSNRGPQFRMWPPHPLMPRPRLLLILQWPFMATAI